MIEPEPLPEQPANLVPSEIAKAFSSLGASKGGKARAKALSPEQRSEIARNAVEARWRRAGKTVKSIPKATHVGILKLGDLEIPCAVLDDGTRLLSQRGVTKALTGAKTISGGHYERVRDSEGDANLPSFLSANNLKNFISPELSATLSTPKEYLPEHGGRTAHGMDATLIPQVCEVWLKAREAKVLKGRQKKIASHAEIIMRGLAQVGIIALIDEATGYQDDRDRRALAKILEAFVAKELKPWVHTFPSDYYRELYRLRGLEYPPKGNRMPRYFGVLTNDIVYRRLAHGVLSELRRVTPRDTKGRLKHKLFQRLTDDIGHPKLLQHLGSVVTLMRMSDDKDYPAFEKLLDRLHPRLMDAPLFEKREKEKLIEGDDPAQGS